MSVLGEDFAGGLFRRLYAPVNPAGLIVAVAAAVGLVLLHQFLQVVLSLMVLHGFFGGDLSDTRNIVKASLVSHLSGLADGGRCRWWLASRGGADAARGAEPAVAAASRRWAGWPSSAVSWWPCMR